MTSYLERQLRDHSCIRFSNRTGRTSSTTHMKPTPALVRLERKLARDRTAILGASEVELLRQELRRALAQSFANFPPTALDQSEDVIRWQPLSAMCKEARRARGIRDMSVITGIPQYRLRAIESGHLSVIRPDLARRYFRSLGIEDWVTRWCRANRELAARAGLLESKRSARPTTPPPSHPRAHREDER